jgi:hypothetical protein
MQFIENTDINNKKNKDIYIKSNGVFINLFNFIRINYFTIIFLIFNIYVIARLTDKNFFRAIFTFIFAENWTYWSHKYCHYTQADPVSKLHMVHHTPMLRYNASSDIIESLVNLIIIGGIILIPINILINRTLNIKLLNNSVLIYWAIIYTTYHLFNFHYYPNISHQAHHKTDTNSNNKKNAINATNYGPEYLDIVNNTKPDGQPIQNISTIVINMIVATIIIYKLRRYIK